MRFSIGSLVVEKVNLRPHTNYTIHKVVALLDGDVLTTMYGDGFDGEIHPFDDEMNKLLNKPRSRSWREGIHRAQESELCTPEEALVELHRMEEIQDNLNKEFESVRASIQEKLDAAAVLVEEAAAIAKPFDKDFYDLSFECRKLYDAQDKNGWRASHIKC